MARGPDKPAEWSDGLRGEEWASSMDWASWVRPQGEIKWEFEFEFQLNLDFDRTWRNCTRRFRRNLDMGIFF
jgi:hypothetical protein